VSTAASSPTGNKKSLLVARKKKQEGIGNRKVDR
jgi:hypothetical protein